MNAFFDSPIVLHAGFFILLFSGVPLALSFVLGLAIGILQAATQIQEQTLSVVPKLGALFCIVFLFGGWGLNALVTYFAALLNAIPGVH